MPQRLPPLTSLRAFEAAGRELSFTRAAEELGVTQAAISHQIKSLEDYLDLALFLRKPRKLALTAAGSALLPVVCDSFARIREALAALAPAAANTTLALRLAPSFAARWLSPRLHDFRAKFPDIVLSLTHSNAAVDFENEPIDLAVTYGHGQWPGVEASLVFSLDFFPVCSPALTSGQNALRAHADLRKHTLLHDADFRNWTEWLALAGLNDIDPARGTVVDDTNVLMQAAMDGLGVALGSNLFVHGLLASGRLVRPFDLTLESDFAYFVVCPKNHLRNPAVCAFRDWLLAQAAASHET